MKERRSTLTSPWTILVALLALMAATVVLTLSASAEWHSRGRAVTLSMVQLQTFDRARTAMADVRYRERNAIFEQTAQSRLLHQRALNASFKALREVTKASESNPTRDGVLLMIGKSWRKWADESSAIVKANYRPSVKSQTISALHVRNYDLAADALEELGADETRRLMARQEELRKAFDTSSKSILATCVAMTISLVAVSVLLRRDRSSRDALVNAERKQREISQQQAERMVRLVHRLPIAAVHNVDGKLTLNRAAQHLLGYSSNEIQSLGDWFRLTAAHHSGAARASYEERKRRGFHDLRERSLRKKDGTIVHIQLAGYADESDEIWILRDVTLERAAKLELERANSSLEKLAATDDLTRLNNQRAFRFRLEDEVSEAASLHRPLSLLLLDVDHFKAYNDGFGHPAGDGALRAVAQVIQSHTRESDFAARYGGEEFAMLLPDTALDEALQIAEKIRLDVEILRWDLRRVTISIGVASLGHETQSGALFELADRALYAAKAQGRNRVISSTESVAAQL